MIGKAERQRAEVVTSSTPRLGPRRSIWSRTAWKSVFTPVLEGKYPARRAHVDRGIDQRAVNIENDRFNHILVEGLRLSACAASCRLQLLTRRASAGALVALAVSRLLRSASIISTTLPAGFFGWAVLGCGTSFDAIRAWS